MGGTARHLYAVFGGPRVCIDAAFAMMEEIVALANLPRSAEFTPTPEPVRALMRTALRPDNGAPSCVRLVYVNEDALAAA